VNHFLASQGIRIGTGTIVDATMVLRREGAHWLCRDSLGYLLIQSYFLARS
jgi:hypothetical protein